jgi:hypothetical protein
VLWIEIPGGNEPVKQTGKCLWDRMENHKNGPFQETAGAPPPFNPSNWLFQRHELRSAQTAPFELIGSRQRISLSRRIQKTRNQVHLRQWPVS